MTEHLTTPVALPSTTWPHEAGVAISTVSRVLQRIERSGRQRPERAFKLRSASSEIRAAAHRQNSGAAVHHGSLAVALPSATSLFYVELLKGVKDALRDHEIDLLLCNLGSRDPGQRLERFLDRGAVGGLLLVSLPVDDALRQRLDAMRAPVVLVGGRADGFDSFWWDDEAGARRAVEHLIQLGHTRIGCIAAHDWSESTGPRLAGYRAAIQAHGLAFDPALVAAGRTEKHAGYSEEAGAEAMEQLMALDAPPTAVFASADVQAFGAWAYARDNGIRVPRDVSIAGYDGLKLSRFLDLTTVDQNALDTGLRATERLLARMQGSAASGRVDVETALELVARGSTAAP